MKGWLDEAAEWVNNALDNLYPERPKTALPPTVHTSQLVGTYYHPGFGPIRLREEKNVENPNESVLKSDREEASWSQKLTFHHVTGDHWIMYAKMYADFQNTALRSQFKIGVDGKPTGLEIEFLSRGGSIPEAVVLFDKVK